MKDGKITLATLALATAQEVYDQVAEHLLTQAEKSADRAGQCKYREPETGFKCAAGCLIGEGEYRSVFEGYKWAGLIAKKEVPEAHGALIRALQGVHDNWLPSQWPIRLERVATDFNLVPYQHETHA